MSEQTKPWHVVYMGTPDFAVPPLQALIDDARYDVVAVVSQPDRKVGRGQKTQRTPVADCADRAKVPTFQPESLRDKEAVATLRGYNADVFVVAAYGQILSEEVLALPAKGCVNIHASLLPAWRGAAPIHWSIIAGDAVTGVSLMKMERGLDTGPTFAMACAPIGECETTGELHDRLAALGATMIRDELALYLSGQRELLVQNSDRSSYARMLHKDDRHISFERPAKEIAHAINGLSPWPGGRANFPGEDGSTQELRLFRARSRAANHRDLPAGTVLSANPDDGLVITGSDGNIVEVLEACRPGKRTMSCVEMLRGFVIQVGKQVS